jgi:hypothetical protein
MYRELQWRFSEVESCSSVSQIAKNCNGIYPINPKKTIYSLQHSWCIATADCQS